MDKGRKKVDKELMRRERRLVARCIKRDEKAWSEFVDTYKRLIYSAIIRTFNLVGYKNAEEAAGDIFQDIFASLLKDNCAKLRSFKWKNGCSLASWLVVVAKNRTFDYIRNVLSRKEITTSFREDPAHEEGLSEYDEFLCESFLKDLEDKEKISIFEKALKELPKEDIYLVDLIYFRELSYKRIAAILGKSIDAVYMQKKRVIDKLKNIIKIRQG